MVGLSRCAGNSSWRSERALDARYHVRDHVGGAAVCLRDGRERGTQNGPRILIFSEATLEE